MKTLQSATLRILVRLNSGLSFVKRWIAAEFDDWFSAFDGISAALTKEM